MEIEIGREEGLRRLHCRVNERDFYIGQVGLVPSSVSRHHCKIVVNGSYISIENIKAPNVTFVDGNQIISKSITPTSKVELGNERFLLPLQQILQLVGALPTNNNAAKKDAPTFSLVPLKSVWAEYEERRMEIQDRAARFANKQRLQGIFSMFGMCIGFIPGIDSMLRLLFVAAALGVGVYFFIKGNNGAIVQRQIKELDEEYADKYKCPNPACGRPFGAIPYRNIEYNKSCLACGCKYTH